MKNSFFHLFNGEEHKEVKRIHPVVLFQQRTCGSPLGFYGLNIFAHYLSGW